MKTIILLLFISIVSLLCLAYINTKEAFVNKVVDANINARPDEIYLVAPNPSSFNIVGKSDGYDLQNKGFTYSQAGEACAAFNGQLADLTTAASNRSKLSLEIALDLSANWCAPGWTASSQTYAYFPMTDFLQGKCTLNNTTNGFTPSVIGKMGVGDFVTIGTRTRVNGVSTTTGISVQPPTSKYYLPTTPGLGVYRPSDGYAFAICVGPKPPLPTARVNPFNTRSYSLYNADMMTYLTTGIDPSDSYKDDIFPINFTEAQVYDALQKAVNNDTPPLPKPYNIENTRKLLINKYKLATESTIPADSKGLTNAPPTATTDPLNYPTYTEKMLTDQGFNTVSDNTGAVLNDSCTMLESAYNNMKNQLGYTNGTNIVPANSLAKLFADISGNVENIIKMKGVNGTLQTVIASVCSNTNRPVESTACERLLSLDYDILYRNKSSIPSVQKNTITDLQIINRNLLMRQCEIQQALGSLEILLKALGGASGTNKCSLVLIDLNAKYGFNTHEVERTVNDPATNKPVKQTFPVPYNCNTYFDKDGKPTEDSTAIGMPPSYSFLVGKKIQMNNVDILKVRLQEITPFFQSDKYANLVSNVLNQLSLTLRTPLPKDYLKITDLTKLTRSLYDVIQGIFPNI